MAEHSLYLDLYGWNCNNCNLVNDDLDDTDCEAGV